MEIVKRKKVNSSVWKDTIVEVNDDGKFDIVEALDRDNVGFILNEDDLRERLQSLLDEGKYSEMNKKLTEIEESGIDTTDFVDNDGDEVIIIDSIWGYKFKKRYQDYIEFGDWTYEVFDVEE